LMYKITGGSSNGIVLYIRFFKEVTEFGRSVSYTYFLAELLSDFIHAFGLHPAHGSALATLPLYFAGRQKKMVSFFKIMIFRCHPKNWNKIFFGMSLFEKFTGINSRNNFIEKIQWSRKKTNLMTCSNRKCIVRL